VRQPRPMTMTILRQPLLRVSVAHALLLIFIGRHSVVGGSSSSGVRRGNAGNCVGIRSCRPRCASFRLHLDDCQARQGIFERTTATAWQYSQAECNSDDADKYAALLRNKNSTLVTVKPLRVQVVEKSPYWSFATEFQLEPRDSDGDDGAGSEFTFCSVYPCPKLECALPEQMVRLCGFVRF